MTGLHINPQYPHLGASPDGLISCSCCGNGLLEIKCPYSKRNLDPTQIVDSSFYLKPTESGLKLSKVHDYYHQVQGQMTICERSYCDFVCWTPLGMHIEWIVKGIPVTFSTWSQSLTASLLVSYYSRCCVNPMETTRKTVTPTRNCFASAEKGNMEAW